MDTNITDADLDHAGVGLAEPFRLPGETERRPGAGLHAEAEPREKLAQSSGAPRRNPFARRRPRRSAEGPDLMSVPHLEGEAPAGPRRRSRRGALLATAAVLVVAGGAGTAWWVHRNGLGGLHLAADVAGLLDHGRRAKTAAVASLEGAHGGDQRTVQPVAQSGSVARSAAPVVAEASKAPAAGPQAQDAPPRPAPSSNPTALADFASLQALPGSGATEVGVAPKPTVPQPVSAPPQESPPSLQAVLPPPASPSSPPAQPMEGHGAEATRDQPTAARSPEATHGQSGAGEAAGGPHTEVTASLPAAAAATRSPSPAIAPPVQPAAPAPGTEHHGDAAPDHPVSVPTESATPPITRSQQLAILGAMKEMAAQLRDTRTEVGELHDTVARLSHQVDSSTSDFDARLSMAETNRMLSDSAHAGAGQPDAGAPSPAPPSTIRLASSRAPAIPAVPAPAPERRTVKDYVVKGASPGLAVLSALNPVTGTPAVIEVAVGDPVPGVGRIKSIFQKGTTWVVQTEAGAIQQ